jgi:hypothetical protein
MTMSDSRVGVRAAGGVVFSGALRHRCQFLLARNAIHQAPSVASRKVKGYANSAPKLASWLERTSPKASP